jgi:hypothetical protein
VVVVAEDKLVDHGWWSACCPAECGDAMLRAVDTFMFTLRDVEDDEVIETRAEIKVHLTDLWASIKTDPEDDIGMGYPRLGVRPGMELVSRKGTLYVIFMK